MSEKINIENYEAFWLDYLEGNLSLQEEKLLQEFLGNHPILRENLEIVEPLKPFSKIEFSKKSILRKEVASLGKINKNNFEEYFAYAVDGEYLEEVLPFTRLNPFLEKEFDYYKKTKLSADKSILYPNKKHLKKTAVFTLNSKKRQWAAAASLFFAISSIWFWSQSNEVQITPVKMALKHVNQIEVANNTAQIEQVQTSYLPKVVNQSQFIKTEKINIDKSMEYKSIEKIPTLNTTALKTPESSLALSLKIIKITQILPKEENTLASNENSILWWKKIGKKLLNSGAHKIEDISNGNLAFQVESNKLNTKKELSLKIKGFEFNHTFATNN